ncbi:MULTISPECIES: TetR/AcrR family transcriptional regulator [Streptomyces]|jgi:AcrR family transcriptional regulator|uniref:AcrR family transcriptional regulator n=2 Tax=Streptomyces TaxID=1883 RepID=A0ABT9LFB2_STRGD|nr:MULTISPECIES: TetR/AcrR family transcriptional regulator [Streptomyces]MDP9681171.1 AcrR family transcriptional regulator [Streptomyces griseoviridis]GGT20394.1 TetR family transcriptional regulator [Streptomyces griseoviridis]GGU60505.1 TetR family transcriptional regulator [Streptomyces daghestanicus]GHI34829.1 TetR family transcriptional regulator [Streptomyces daghestanicus]
MAEDTRRPLRADARRNREKILTAAVRVFAEEGLDAHLERVAKAAGVGSATLYRNFPTREALIEAVYRNEVAQLCEAVPGLLAARPPYEALRAWTRLFLDYVTAKLGMAEALRAIAATGGNPYGQSRDMIEAALSDLMDACVAAGAIRSDVAPGDVSAALAGIALSSARPDQRDQAERLLDLVLDGLTVRRP